MTEEKIIELPFVTAIIVAAGNSTRMGTEISKQLLTIHGVPVIAKTLKAFEESELVKEVIIVSRERDMVQFWDIVKYFDFKKVKNIVSGGDTRQKSVMCGISAASKQAEYFAIHDGARPLIKSFTIDKAICDAYHHKASAVGVKVKDTIKQVNREGFIVTTPDRDYIYAIQTPQVFEKELYMSAVKKSDEDGTDYTDDCQLVECLHVPIYLTQGEYSNIKITTKEDIIIAEKLEDEEELK